MSGAHGEDDLFGIEMLEREAGHLLRRGKPPDDEIQVADAQLLQENGILAGDDLDAAAGRLLQEERHRPRHDACGDRRQCSDADGWRCIGKFLGDGINPLLQRRQCCAGVPQEDFAIARDADAPTLALEDRDAESLFELPDGLGHRRLADMQDIGGLDDAFLSGNLKECMQVTKLDPGIDQQS